MIAILASHSEHAGRVFDPLALAVLAWRNYGDENAARIIVRELSPAVRGVAVRMLPRSWMVDDAVQDTLANVFRSIDRFDGRVPLAAWAVRIAKNFCADLIRTSRRRRTACATDVGVEELDEFERGDEHPGLGDIIVAREELRLVLQRFAAMDDADRMIAHLVLFYGCSMEEAASEVGIGAGALRLRVFRIRGELRRDARVAR